MALNFKKDIERALLQLLEMSNEFTYNNISDNCSFILSEIQNSDKNFLEQWLLAKKENDKKVPVSLEQILPELESIYDNLHDINLHVYRSSKNLTIIDIRYYLKASLENAYRNTVQGNGPMLHSKIPMPPWRNINDTRKFDINWPHYIWLYRWQMFLAKIKWKFKWDIFAKPV